jgi:hypothetical protein
VGRVYLDPSAILMPAELGVPRQAVPGASDALRMLQEGGDEVTLVGEAELAGAIEVPDGVAVQERLPQMLDADSWFVTADPQTITDNQTAAQTLLVGPRRPPGPVPLPRYDVEARDLPAAVIEILARQAMG